MTKKMVDKLINKHGLSLNDVCEVFETTPEKVVEMLLNATQIVQKTKVVGKADPRIQKILELKASGLGIMRIAKKLKISTSTYYNLMQGVKAPLTKVPANKIAQHTMYN
jgi:DNA-binding NarL/FixJ family response regulator